MDSNLLSFVEYVACLYLEEHSEDWELIVSFLLKADAESVLLL